MTPRQVAPAKVPKKKQRAASATMDEDTDGGSTPSASPRKAARPRASKRVSSGKTTQSSLESPSQPQSSRVTASQRARARSPSYDSDGMPIAKPSPRKPKLSQRDRAQIMRDQDEEVAVAGSDGEKWGELLVGGGDAQQGELGGEQATSASQDEADAPRKKRKVGRLPKAAGATKSSKVVLRRTAGRPTTSQATTPPAEDTDPNVSDTAVPGPSCALAGPSSSSFLSAYDAYPSPPPERRRPALSDSDHDEEELVDPSAMFNSQPEAGPSSSKADSASPSKSRVVVSGKRDPRLRDGEHIYYLEKGEYWPGTIVDFVPAGSRPNLLSDRYEIEMIGHRGFKPAQKLRLKMRKDIIHQQERAIADCRLGKFQITLAPEPSDIAAAPASSGPDTLTGDAFAALSYPEQLAAVRPHLERVIRDEYLPALDYVDMVYARKAELDVVRGDLDEAVISGVFWPELRAWLLPGRDAQGGDLLRPKGSERYEELDDKEKDDFVFEVLIGEAIRAMVIRVNNLDSKTADELIADLSDFGYDPDKVAAAAVSTDGSLELIRHNLAQCFIDEQEAMKAQQSGAIISGLLAARTRMRNKLGIAPEVDEKAKKREPQPELYTERGRPLRTAKKPKWWVADHGAK